MRASLLPHLTGLWGILNMAHGSLKQGSGFPRAPPLGCCVPNISITFLVITDDPGEFLGKQDPEAWLHNGTDSQRESYNVYYKSLIVTPKARA